MNSKHPSNERPRSEPEIIPPEHIEARSGKWRSFHQRRTYRVHVTRSRAIFFPSCRPGHVGRARGLLFARDRRISYFDPTGRRADRCRPNLRLVAEDISTLKQSSNAIPEVWNSRETAFSQHAARRRCRFISASCAVPRRVGRLGPMRNPRACCASAYSHTSPPTIQKVKRASRPSGLQALGWIEGLNIRIDYRWSEGDADRPAQTALFA